MMSLSKVSSGAAAASYYEEADDYYSEDGRAPSSWWGVITEALGLEGAVDAAQFKDLLDGKFSDGTELHGGAEGRRSGTDLTFSAPKSVSMQALIGGDARLLNGHEEAVTRTLAYAQERLAAYRFTVKCDTHRVTSGNLLVARFRHDLSRDCDPQLHTHCVVVNATLNEMGEWRALDISEFYRQQKLLGAFYRAELAREVQTLGYGVRLTHDDGRFELAHIADEHVAAFSHRSQSINDALAKRGKDRNSASAKEKELAGLSTRQSKRDCDRAQLRETWKATSATLHINYTPPIQAELTSTQRTAALQAAVHHAINHTTERQSIVTHANLVGVALGRATGAGVLTDVEVELARKVEAGELYRVGERYTTAEAQQNERKLLTIEARGRDARTSISQQLDVLCSLTASTLNVGQRAAAEAILTSHNRIMGVQGLAGTGKTHMLAEVQTQAERKGWSVTGVAPSAAAALELGKAGIATNTIASFLVRGGSALNATSLLIVDEAGMVPVVDMLAILLVVEKADAHVVLVGDTQQLKAVAAGKPFAQLQAAGMKTIEMGEIMRQQNVTLKTAVEHAAKGEVAASLKLMAPRIAEIDHANERYARIAHDYSSLLPAERNKTLVLAGTNAARLAINAEVRLRLGLAGSGVEVAVLERRDLTQAQLKSSLSYQPGDVVQMLATYESLELLRGMLTTVTNAESGRITLLRPDGQSVEWRPALMSKVAAYQVGARELTVGDVVRFNENNYARDYINGDRGCVVAIDRERAVLTIEKTNGQQVTLDSRQPLQLDHGYCTTVHSSQGQTCERVLIDADVKSAMASESLYYVAISRAKFEAQIYTDDKTLLPEAMGRLDEKSAALDLSA